MLTVLTARGGISAGGKVAVRLDLSRAHAFPPQR